MSEYKPLTGLTPVPVRPRHDGWTAERQIAFVEKLDHTNSISACRRVGMRREAVRKLALSSGQCGFVPRLRVRAHALRAQL